MKPEDYSERQLELHGWPVRLTTYRLGAVWHAKIDNVSPGAWLARVDAASREEAENQALETAGRRLARTRRAEI
jgi:hypothetical protein